MSTWVMLGVRRLTKHYGGLVAIHDVSFEARPGEVLGLLGPNGSGKSTTVKILTGLLQQTSGVVQLDGGDAFADLEAYKRHIGYVPEEPHLYSYLSGPEYLRLVGRLRELPEGVLDDKIDCFLQLLGIYDDRYQTLSSYSKGMRQKILIAASVLHNPRIVILDEPFSGLDVSAARGAEWDAGARRAIAITAAMTAAAVATTVAGYRRQLQLALAPAATTSVRIAARIPRAIAFLATGRSRLARAVSDFILITIARSSGQQATIAINAALGLTLIVAGLLRTRGDLTEVMRPRTAVLWIPLLLTYSSAVGVRAAFFMPSELPASWAFRFNGPTRTTAYWAATRAALIGFLATLAIVADALIVPLIGIRAAAWHATIVVSTAVLLAETIALSVDFVPFTRPYAAGHAKLKTRWPLYVFGLYVFAFWPARAALHAGSDPLNILQIAAWLLATAALLEIVGRYRARNWRVDPAEEFHEPSTIAVLDIGMAVPGAFQP